MDERRPVEELLARARAGEPAAAEALLSRLAPYVRLLVRPRLGGRLGAKLDEADLTQEALLRIHRGLDQFTGTEADHFLGWVGRVVSNVVADHARHFRADKRDLTREEAGPEVLEGLLADDTTPPGQVVRAEEATRLAAALSQLPPVQREILEARFFEGRPFADIARDLGKSSGAVRVVCLRAVNRLRRELAADAGPREDSAAEPPQVSDR
jgi:RNA polymerase sigma-70 factor (ECF subfamily)